MNREEFEELLPAYIDGALNAEQTARVDEWLERSADARESLEIYRRLDSALEMRREQVPPPYAFAEAVFTGARLNRVRRVMNAVFSFPGISSTILVLFGIALVVYRRTITDWINRAPDLPETPGNLDWLRSAFQQVSGMDMWTVVAVYAGVTLLILASTSVMLMRYLRD